MSLDYGDALLPYTKVRIITDNSGDETRYYEAGTDTGRTLEFFNPWGTQAMADNILEQINGYVYQPFEARGAFLPDEAELGDGVWVGDTYGPLVAQDIDFNHLGTSDISAPGGDDVDNEFDIEYLPPEVRAILRQESRITSLIVEQGRIRSEISDAVSGLSTTIEQTLESITLSVTNGENGTTFTLKAGETELSTDTLDLHVKAVNIDGLLTASQINVSTLHVGSGGISVDSGAISWGNLASGVRADINGAVSDAGYALSAAQDAEDAISAWTYGGTTYIDGSQIMTGTVTASHLLGGTVSLLASDNRTVGDLSIAYTTTGYGLGITTDYGGIKIESAGNIFLDAGSGGSLTMQNNTIVLSATDLCLSSYSFGSGAPSGTGSYGQVYFQLVS